MRQEKLWLTMSGILVVLATALMLAPGAGAQSKYKTLHKFGLKDAAGNGPNGVTLDAAGNLYGTTSDGGNGYGSVFKLTHGSDGKCKERMLYGFGCGNDGAHRKSDL
jgi:hypothetical protein